MLVNQTVNLLRTTSTLHHMPKGRKLRCDKRKTRHRRQNDTRGLERFVETRPAGRAALLPPQLAVHHLSPRLPATTSCVYSMLFILRIVLRAACSST